MSAYSKNQMTSHDIIGEERDRGRDLEEWIVLKGDVEDQASYAGSCEVVIW